MQDNQSIAGTLETLGTLLIENGTHVASGVEFISAAVSLREKLRIRLGPIRKQTIDLLINRSKTAIGELEFVRAYETGRRTKVQQIISTALSISV
jgi:hypothetical protein